MRLRILAVQCALCVLAFLRAFSCKAFNARARVRSCFASCALAAILLLSGASSQAHAQVSCDPPDGGDAVIEITSNGSNLVCTSGLTTAGRACIDNGFINRTTFDDRHDFGTVELNNSNELFCRTRRPGVTTTVTGGGTCDSDSNLCENMVDNSSVITFSHPTLSALGDLRFTHIPGRGNASIGIITQVDVVAPRVTAIERQNPATSPTDADTLTWRVTFSEDVANVDSTDFVVTGPTGATINVATQTADTVFDVTVSGGDLAGFNGNVTLGFAAGQNIEDLAATANALTDTAPTGTNEATYVVAQVDNVAPRVTSIERQTPATSPTDADTLTWRVTFNEDVANVDSTDFVVTGPTGATINVATQTADTMFDVTVSGGDLAGFNGNVTLGFAAGQNIEDLAATANALTDTTPTGANEATYVVAQVDNIAPRVTSIERQNPATSPTDADTLTWRVTFSEDVANVDSADFVVTGPTGATINVVTQTADTVFDVTVSGGDLAGFNGNATLGFAAGQNIEDLAATANALTDTTPTGANNNSFEVRNIVVVDTEPPTVEIDAPNEARGPFTATFTFSEDVSGFDVSDVLVGNGSITQFMAVTGARYTALITPGKHGVAVTLDISAGAAQDLAGNPNIAAVQSVTKFIDENFVRVRTKGIISNFVRRRADQITAAEPDLAGREIGGGSAAGGGSSVTASGSGTNSQFAFATSLSSIADANALAANSGMMALGKQLGSHQAGAMRKPWFDVWAQGRWAHVDNESSQTNIGLLYVGIDFETIPGVRVGVLTQFDWASEDNAAERFSAEGRGWMTGPYWVVRLHKNLIFDGRVAWGKSNNEVSPFSTYTDRFDGTRRLAKAQLTGDFNFDGWHFSPHVSVLSFKEKQKSYVDSLGIRIDGQEISLGRMTFGPKLSTVIELNDGTSIAPHIEVKGIWDFSDTSIVDITSGLEADGAEGLRARIEGGVSANLSNGWSFAVAGFYDGIGARDFEAYGGTAKLSVPLN